jgi:tagatose-6-phosphate ketose/aldose isomerase
MTTTDSAASSLGFPSGLPSAQLQARGAGHTAREIAQQPALWREVERLAESRRAEVAAFLDPLLTRKDLRIVLTGAGTSAFAGEVLAADLGRHLGRRVEAIATTDLVSNPQQYLGGNEPTLLVSFARSGDSPESVAATRLADEFLSDCHHLVVTCNVEGQLYRDHHGAERSLVLAMPAEANDHGFAMTSSFTCMLLAVLATLGGQTDDAAVVERLARAGEQVLADRADAVRELANRGYERIVYLGSGPLKGLARESALKMLELSAGRVATWFDSPLGFRHGPKSIVDPRTLVIVYVSNDPHTRKYDLDIVAELRAAMPAQDVIAIGAVPDERLSGESSWQLTGVADVDDVHLALPLVVCAQMLALHVSLALGKTPDNPFPDNAVNRVVQGVTIYPVSGRP